MTFTARPRIAKVPRVRAPFLIAVTLLAACKADVGPFYSEVDAASAFRVTGTVAGLWAPAGVSLRLEAGGAEQVVNVDEDGAFEFEPYLDDGTPFVVEIAGQPDQHDCVIADGIGTIDGADAAVTVRCTGPIEVDIDWTAHQPLGFDPLQATTHADVSLLVREVQLVVTAPEATFVTVNGAVSTTASLTIPTGASTWTVRVEVGSFSRDFVFELTRGVESPAHALYAKASNAEQEDRFGNSLAASGDTLVVGAPFEDSGSQVVDGDESDDSAQAAGAVYVFRFVDGDWVQEAYLKASNAGQNDGFGASVAIDGEVIVVGADSEASAAVGVDGDEDDNSLPGAGAAYVFRRTADTWTQEAYLKASNPGEQDHFGSSVGISGNRIVVGAPRESSDSDTIDSGELDDSAGSAGAAYVFERTVAWEQTAYLKASNSDAGDQFGTSVAIDGERVVVGAPKERSNAEGPNGDQDDNSFTDAGAAYVFKPSETGWVQETYLKPLGTEEYMDFGAAVALSGTIAVVTAPAEGDGADWWIGRAFVFSRSGAYWSVEANLRASNAHRYAWFGSSVAIDGDTIVIGAHGEASNATGVDGDDTNQECTDAGAAYVFQGTDGWEQAHYLKRTTAPVCGAQDVLGDRFGAEVALTSTYAAIAVPGDDSSATGLNGDGTDRSAPESGGAHVFE
jgi:hypothetical protein